MNRTTDERERICAMSEDYKPELRWKITAETTIDDGHEERSSFTVNVKPLCRAEKDCDRQKIAISLTQCHACFEYRWRETCAKIEDLLDQLHALLKEAADTYHDHMSGHKSVQST